MTETLWYKNMDFFTYISQQLHVVVQPNFFEEEG